MELEILERFAHRATRFDRARDEDAGGIAHHGSDPVARR